MSLLDLFNPSARVKTNRDFEKNLAQPLIEQLKQQQYTSCVAILDQSNSAEIGSLLYGLFYYTDALKLAEQWCQKAPDSAHAHALFGRCLQLEGWKVRGTGYRDTVSDRAMKKFQSYLESAQQHLTRATELTPNLPMAYASLILGGKAMGHSLEKLNEWFQQGVALDPFHYYCHHQFFQALMEKWLGNHSWMFDFAFNASDAAPPGDNLHILVAHAFVERAQTMYHQPGGPILPKKRFANIAATIGQEENKQMIKKAFYLWLDSTPETAAEKLAAKQNTAGIIGKNAFALALILMGCKEEARLVFQELNQSIIPDPWEEFERHKGVFFKLCKGLL